VVWAGRFAGIRVPERVAGIDLMQSLWEVCEAEGWPVYFLGARQEVLDAFVTVVRKRHPDLVIAGARNGYFDDDAAVAEEIRRSGARVVFVAISSPRKEVFLNEQLARMGPVLAVGVGGSFDVIAGLTRRAPRWMQVRGLEWFYRFLQEPERLRERYVTGNTRFVGLMFAEAWRQQIYPRHETRDKDGGTRQ